MRDAIEALHGGAIGNVNFGRAFYYNNRKAIGWGEQKAAGDLDFNLWQGPVPDDAAHDLKRYTHCDWHWLWHWGNGALGNNGVHTLDILRWGLKAGYPLRVTYIGARPPPAADDEENGHAGWEGQGIQHRPQWMGGRESRMRRRSSRASAVPPRETREGSGIAVT